MATRHTVVKIMRDAMQDAAKVWDTAARLNDHAPTMQQYCRIKASEAAHAALRYNRRLWRKITD